MKKIFNNPLFKKFCYVVAAICVVAVIIGMFINAGNTNIFAQQPENVLSITAEVQTVPDTTSVASLQPADESIEVDSRNQLHEAISSLKPNITFKGVLRAILGVVVILFICWLFSRDRKNIKWKYVFSALAFQVVIAVCILYVPFVATIFEFFGKIFVYINRSAAEGMKFLMGGLMGDSIGYVFAFNVLPTIIFFSAITSLLFHWGVIQVVVKWLGWFFSKLMGLTGVESLSLAGNIFLGQTEAPLIVKHYLPNAKDSEIFLVMVGGMATMSGGILASYIAMLGGADTVLQVAFAKHLLAASVMAAPASVVIGRIIFPSQADVKEEVKLEKENKKTNTLDVISSGAIEGMKLAVNVATMLLVFIALIAFVNFTFGKIGDWTNLNNWIVNNTPYAKFSLEFILGYALSPLMWLIGVPAADMLELGQLLGIKTIVNEFVGYGALQGMIASNSLSTKGVVMAVYLLCGFANFSSIGIQIGGIGSLAPNKRYVLAKYGMLALFTAAVTALLSSVIMGMLLG
ncbi:Na+ dependent nucleoside transporter [Bacteroidales bacterium OttesenSCG-928-K03]|nr:Na+ dependent nucleoside transporter [Bacteroidales bacterium OttesenSCG-928-L14]MDL2240333.1 Na+ dependent nucleoside transporter [Bacteroidales bacterium OttesenSCG-928-K22]MDL2243026.1 Na+ dependent nucleoside transporter [Bacteroidales bacterium OttesenSCG-928-K03]